MTGLSPAEDRRAANGLHYRIEGRGEPLLLLHGLLASGRMFDPLVPLLRDRFRLIIPDLRGHGQSGAVGGPYDVPALASDLDAVLEDAGCTNAAVLGYSHGGAVAQQFARNRPDLVGRLMLACTYACNVSTFREHVEANILLLLLRLFSLSTLAKLIIRPAKPGATGAIGLSAEQAEWLRAILSENSPRVMREAAKGLITFDSRPWLNEIEAPTLIVAGTHDSGVPRHHFEMLTQGIPGASGRLVDRAGHTLAWTHTREFADIIRQEWPRHGR